VFLKECHSWYLKLSAKFVSLKPETKVSEPMITETPLL
jgi:hypothetical protein